MYNYLVISYPTLISYFNLTYLTTNVLFLKHGVLGLKALKCLHGFTVSHLILPVNRIQATSGVIVKYLKKKKEAK